MSPSWLAPCCFSFALTTDHVTHYPGPLFLVAGPLLLASAFPRWCAAETAKLWDRTFSPLSPSTRPPGQRDIAMTKFYVNYHVSVTTLAGLCLSRALAARVVHTANLRIDPCNSGDSSAARTGRSAMHGFLFLPPDASHTRPCPSRGNLHHPSPLDRLRLRDRSCVGACRCAAQVSGNCIRV